MDKFFICFWGRPTDGDLPNPILELSENITLFNLNRLNSGLDGDTLKNELLDRWLLYPHNPDLRIEVPTDSFDIPPCWGILVWIEWVDDFRTHLSLLELYTGHIFTPLYYIDHFGRPRAPYELYPRGKTDLISWWDDNLCHLLNNKFLQFLELLSPVLDTINTDNRDINQWLLENKTEWFLFMGWLTLFSELRKYFYGKSPVYWLKEALDIGVILEIVLGWKPYRDPSILDKFLSFIKRNQFDPIVKTLTRRTRRLVWMKIFWKSTAKIIDKIYDYRSRFAHGEFANDIRNSYDSSSDGCASIKVNSDIFNEPNLWQQSLRIIIIVALVLYSRRCEGYFWNNIHSIKELLDKAENSPDLASKIDIIRNEVLSKIHLESPRLVN